jgi:hypothetical protein
MIWKGRDAKTGLLNEMMLDIHNAGEADTYAFFLREATRLCLWRSYLSEMQRYAASHKHLGSRDIVMLPAISQVPVKATLQISPGAVESTTCSDSGVDSRKAGVSFGVFNRLNGIILSCNAWV